MESHVNFECTQPLNFFDLATHTFFVSVIIPSQNALQAQKFPADKIRDLCDSYNRVQYGRIVWYGYGYGRNPGKVNVCYGI